MGTPKDTVLLVTKLVLPLPPFRRILIQVAMRESDDNHGLSACTVTVCATCFERSGSIVN